MRAIGHALSLFVVIVVLGAATHFSLGWLKTTDFFAGPNGISVSRSTAYRVSSSEWLEFGITERGPIRLVSNCAFNRVTQHPTRYALDYELEQLRIQSSNAASDTLCPRLRTSRFLRPDHS